MEPRQRPQDLVGAGVAVVQGPDGIEAFDDPSGSHLWSIPGLDRFFRVQPESGVVAVYQFNNPTVRLVDLRSGVERAEVAENQSNIFPLSSKRVVRTGRERYDNVGADGRVFWTVARPDPAEGEDVWLLGKDLVTISDHCDQG